MNIKLYCYIYRIYLQMRNVAKTVLRGRQADLDYLFVDLKESDFDETGILKCSVTGDDCYIDGHSTKYPIKKDELFPIENLVTNASIAKQYSKSYRNKRKEKPSYTHDVESAVKLWPLFLVNSRIPDGYKYAGFSYAGYIEEYQEWCLPSWIWTNAAAVRYYCMADQIDEALQLGKVILQYQVQGKGWIVRNDYGVKNIKPLLAPNDSAYIANNACLEIYKKTKIQEYLDAAIECADWIIETARQDGMVYFGYDTFSDQWETDHNIVDVGFTAGLFAELYEITNNNKYSNFARKFTETYIKLFFDKEKGRFWSSIGLNDKPRGTGFSRGQAWALEGLIPVYKWLGDETIKPIINSTVQHLIRTQNKDGSWPRELDNPNLGPDCKGTPVIAYSLHKWLTEGPLERELYEAASKAVSNALQWCGQHTAENGNGLGGIYSFCYEGAIVHHPFTSTAFAYSSAYALELYYMSKG